MSIGRFQCGIAAVIYHPPTQTYLLLQRSAAHEVGRGEWESVTGRVNQGESFEMALRREVQEELGVDIQPEFIIGTSHFYRGEAKPENELLGVKYACTLDHRDAIQPGAEHQAYRWLSAEEVYALLPPNHWLHQSIERAEFIRRHLPPELAAFYKNQGFESA